VKKSLISLIVLVSFASSARAEASAWGKIGFIALGMSQAAIIEQHGYGINPNEHGGSYRLDGGSVQAIYLHGYAFDVGCGSWQVISGGTRCPMSFVLPDGVKQGTRVPFRTPWEGYRRLKNTTGSVFFIYAKAVRDPGGRRVHVALWIEEGKVVAIDETI
jgi:hypothetical protein